MFCQNGIIKFFALLGGEEEAVDLTKSNLCNRENVLLLIRSFLGSEDDVYCHIRSSAQGVDLTLSYSVCQWQAVYALMYMCPAT